MTNNSWQKIVENSFASMNRDYLENLQNYFPQNYLAPFQTLEYSNTRYILFGQDPYPRQESATGYSFIDGRVKSIFSQNGLSKEVNRATSLRNFIKMLLSIDGYETTQESIAKIDKYNYIDSIDELRVNFEKNGVLLLNIVPIFTKKEDLRVHLREWKIFTKTLLTQLQESDIELILFGKVASIIEGFNLGLKVHKFEHPYNISFIESESVKTLFRDMRLLSAL